MFGEIQKQISVVGKIIKNLKDAYSHLQARFELETF